MRRIRHNPFLVPPHIAEFDPDRLTFDEWRAARRRYVEDNGWTPLGGAAEAIRDERTVRLALTPWVEVADESGAE